MIDFTKPLLLNLGDLVKLGAGLIALGAWLLVQHQRAQAYKAVVKVVTGLVGDLTLLVQRFDAHVKESNDRHVSRPDLRAITGMTPGPEVTTDRRG